ncbi:MAG: stearoyl-CoA 9-desaturase [Blastocatellia bacterium]|nr:MAG: stearoyl-CoA 9-desaturase [Blastocatellia bacterium]
MRTSMALPRALPALLILLLHTQPIIAVVRGAHVIDWIVCTVLYLLSAFGLGVGLHRYFAHRSFETSRAFQFVLCLFSSIAFGDPVWFAGKHRLHHKHSDTNLDVHSPHQGFWFCWFASIFDEGYSDEEILAKARDLTRYPELMWIHRHYYIFPVAIAAATYLVGGYSMFAIGYCLSLLLALHAASAVNYYCHKGKNRRYDTQDRSTNNSVLGVLTFGEGWHNNHHHYPGTARAGFFWWELDVFYYVLRILSVLGLVWNLREVPNRVKYDFAPSPNVKA